MDGYGGDYGGFRALLSEARALREQQRATPIVACPRCGSLLQYRRNLASCPMGHWRGSHVMEADV